MIRQPLPLIAFAAALALGGGGAVVAAQQHPSHQGMEHPHGVEHHRWHDALRSAIADVLM